MVRTALVPIVFVWACSFSPTAVSEGGGDGAPADVGPDGPPPARWLSLATGLMHACGVREDGRLSCWGANEYGQLGDGTVRHRDGPVEVGEAAGWSAVTAGYHHTCALRSAELWCWGANFASQLGDRTDVGKLVPTRIAAAEAWKAVAAGAYHTCAVRADDTLWCWGANDYHQLGDGTAERRSEPTRVGAARWRTLSAGAYHTCGVAEDERLYCWGDSSQGQTGTMSLYDPVPVPVPLPSPDRWLALSLGALHTCGVRETTGLWCWGYGDFGQIGDGLSMTVRQPKSIDPGAWSSISAGMFHTCGTRADGSLWCWGQNHVGQVGDGTRDARPSPAQAGESAGWAAAAAGRGAASCALRADGSAWCWGHDADGRAGDGDPAGSPRPARVADATGEWTAVATGAGVSCALGAAGLVCAGDALLLGVARDQAALSPVAGGPFASVSVGGGSACALDTSGYRHCWGDDSSGQLGNGPFTTDQAAPMQIGDGPWVGVDVGATFSCGIASNFSGWCWGRNLEGQLGDGSQTGTQQPVVSLSGSLDWLEVEAGTYHACGRRMPGSLWCWGANGRGQLGDTTFVTASTPRQAASAFIDWIDVSVGLSHSCAVRSDGTLWCWGDNTYGQLGLGAAVPNAVVPTQAPGQGYTRVACGTFHTCALDGGGVIRCWGDGEWGQIGTGADGAELPVPLEGRWRDLDTQSLHTCALSEDGGLWCWGYNSRGQLATEPWKTVPARVAD